MIRALKSNTIDTVDYDEQKLTLKLKFTDGSLYTYHKVPLSTYLELNRAKSAGAFYNKRIRPFFKVT